MDRSGAERMSLLLEEAIDNIGQAQLIAMNELRDHELEYFRSSVSGIVARITADLLGTIYAHHPDLDDDPTRTHSRRDGSRG